MGRPHPRGAHRQNLHSTATPQYLWFLRKNGDRGSPRDPLVWDDDPRTGEEKRGVRGWPTGGGGSALASFAPLRCPHPYHREESTSFHSTALPFLSAVVTSRPPLSHTSPLSRSPWTPLLSSLPSCSPSLPPSSLIARAPGLYIPHPPVWNPLLPPMSAPPAKRSTGGKEQRPPPSVPRQRSLAALEKEVVVGWE